MNAILYTTIFIIGTLFGSFYSLAVYRIPRKIDIVKTHSFCPTCKHKLGFWELIPMLSYIALGGKCKNCKEKIRPRYFILEILSGLVLVGIAYALNLNIYTLDINIAVQFGFICLYLVAIFLIAGIDNENRKIEKSVVYYALVVSIAYIIYLCVIDNTSIYRYAMYLISFLVLLIVDTLIIKKSAKNNYTISILMLIIAMAVFTGEYISILTIIFTLLIITITLLIYKLKNNLNKIKKMTNNINEEIPIAFYMCISNVILIFMVMFLIK